MEGFFQGPLAKTRAQGRKRARGIRGPQGPLGFPGFPPRKKGKQPVLNSVALKADKRRRGSARAGLLLLGSKAVGAPGLAFEGRGPLWVPGTCSPPQPQGVTQLGEVRETGINKNRFRFGPINPPTFNSFGKLVLG